MCNGTFFGPSPSKRSNIIRYHQISITKSISKTFKPNFVGLLTNERYKTYQTGFSFGCLGHAPGVGLWGNVGGGCWGKKKVFLKFNQISCMSYLHTAPFFRSLSPWEGQKGQIPLNLNYKVTFNDFYTRLCVSSH